MFFQFLYGSFTGLARTINFFASCIYMCTYCSSRCDFVRSPQIMRRHRKHNDYYSPLPKTYINEEDLPDSFFWGNVNGTSYLTRSLNQHIPQYCGSCWAHAAMSSLSDRIKISRGAENIGPDINLSIQFILNCGSEVAGSCHGGEIFCCLD